MSRDAIFATTKALQARIEEAVGFGKVHVGPPKDAGGHAACLFLFNVVPNRELRNAERRVPPRGGAAPSGAAPLVDALPVDLRYLISVFREAGAEPNELTTLGAIMQTLHSAPTLAGSILAGQTVRVTPEPYSIEEMNRIWSLFPDDIYRTSVIYLASPVFIESPLALGPPVAERTLNQGLLPDTVREAEAVS